MDKDKGKSEIQEFFSGKTVFITGATGFLGSVLLEKLLRSCPDISKFYLLVREKKGLDPERRLNTILSSKLFSLLDRTKISQKIILVSGKIDTPGLGISPEDRKTLISEVSVIFHVASTTNFGAHLRRAVAINVEGTERILELAHEMKNLQVLLYTSTAYCNAVVMGITMEEIYPSYMDSDRLLQELQKMTDAKIQENTISLLEGYPTTYSFTKHMAETVLYRKRKSVPVAIVRPSVVLGTLDEPIPGWVENVQNGAVAFIAGAGKGIFRTILGDDKAISDIVPCDIVANLTVAAAWDVARQGEGTFKIYHCTSGLDNPITLKDYCNLTIEKVRQFPCSEVVWYPAAKCRFSMLRNYIFIFLFHLLPGYALVLWEKWNSTNRPVIEFHKKFIRGMVFLQYFTTKNWSFDTKNTKKLASDLCEADKVIFNFDVRRIYWPSYFEKCILGVRHFYHGDYPESIEKSRNNIKILRALHYGFYFGVFGVSYFLLTLCGIPFWSAILGALSAFAFIFWL